MRPVLVSCATERLQNPSLRFTLSHHLVLTSHTLSLPRRLVARNSALVFHPSGTAPIRSQRMHTPEGPADEMAGSLLPRLGPLTLNEQG